MASASELAALMVKNAALKDAANRAAIKLGYTRGIKEEQLEVVVAFLSGSDISCMPAFCFQVARGD